MPTEAQKNPMETKIESGALNPPALDKVNPEILAGNLKDVKGPNSDDPPNGSEKKLDKDDYVAGIRNKASASLNELIADEEDNKVYFDVLMKVLETWTSTWTEKVGLQLLYEVLSSNDFSSEKKKEILKWMLESIGAKIKDNFSTENLNENEYDSLINDLIKQNSLEWISVKTRTMIAFSHKAPGEKDFKTDQLSAWWFAHGDKRNWGSKDPKGSGNIYDINAFKTDYMNKSLVDKEIPGAKYTRYNMLKEEDPVQTSEYNSYYLQEGIKNLKNEAMQQDKRIRNNNSTFNISVNKEFENNEKIKEEIYRFMGSMSITNKDNIKINFINKPNPSHPDIQLTVDVGEEKINEIWDAPKEATVTTHFDATESAITEEKKSQLINQFKEYLKKDEDGNVVLNNKGNPIFDTDTYKVYSIQSVEGNASNTGPTEKNPEYAKNRLDTGVDFLTDIGIDVGKIEGKKKPPQVIETAPWTNPEENQNFKIQWNIQKIKQKGEVKEGFTRTPQTNIIMPQVKKDTWEVLEIKLNSESRDTDDTKFVWLTIKEDGKRK
jgi:hypothetical protein